MSDLSPSVATLTPSSLALPAQLVIASRESRLAMWQAEHVQARLRALYPACEVRIHGMTTQGDQQLQQSLAKIGGKGLFVKELETALQMGSAHLAVHSLKDVPYALPEGFELTAVLGREDPHDAWVSTRYARMEDLPQGARVGTSSLRRASQLLAWRGDLRIEPLRGNLDTRLMKLDRGDFDGIVLAAAGLKRLGLAQRMRHVLPTTLCLPAVGQGVLGIEIALSQGAAQSQQLRHWLAPLNHLATLRLITAERGVAKALGASCATPLAAHATWLDEPQQRMHLAARLAQPDGKHLTQVEGQATVAQASHAEALAQDLVAQLRQRVPAEVFRALGLRVMTAAG